jgi:hypothetical protein
MLSTTAAAAAPEQDEARHQNFGGPRTLPEALQRLREFPDLVGWVVAASAGEFAQMLEEIETPIADVELRPLMNLSEGERREILAWKHDAEAPKAAEPAKRAA